MGQDWAGLDSLMLGSHRVSAKGTPPAGAVRVRITATDENGFTHVYDSLTAPRARFLAALETLTSPEDPAADQ